MSDDRSRDDDLSVSGSFEHWLEREAADKDVSREQLFEQLVSSYWTLNEVEQLLGGSEDRDRNRTASESPRSDPVEDLDALRDRLDEIEDEVATEVERQESMDALARALATRLGEAEDALDELAAEIESVRETVDRKHDAVAERTDDLERELDELAAEVESVRRAVDRKHDAVVERTDALEEELERERETRAAEQERIGSRLDSEFENLETILTYLVSRTDELEAAVSDTDSKYEEALARMRSERDALDAIKRDAADAGVETGRCESCDQEIDLGLLSRPYCPNCEHSLTGVDERQKWFFLSDVVVTTEEGTRERPGESEADAGAAGTEPDVDASDLDLEFGSDAGDGGDGGDDGDGSGFVYGAVSDESPGSGRRSAEEPASRDDAAKGDESDGGDDTDSPFGDLSDLPGEEYSDLPGNE